VHVLKDQGHSLREISRLLRLSRNTVRRILRAHERQAAASLPCAAQTLAKLEDAFSRARGNVARVQCRHFDDFAPIDASVEPASGALSKMAGHEI
jgi:hypothetical protein